VRKHTGKLKAYGRIFEGRGRVTAINAFSRHRRLCSALMVGTMLGGIAVPAYAQQAAAPAPAAPVPAVAPGPGAGTIRSITVIGNERLEPETVLSYMTLRVGEAYDRERLDAALRELYNTELFADVVIGGEATGNITVQVRENPVINRIILEGNKRLKDDKITPEIRLAPRQIFTRSKARADVARIVELYRRQGRYAARVEPKIVQLDQNRVDVVFEIDEGALSKVRQINIIGNQAFSDAEIRSEMATRQARLTSFFSGNTSYDPDRLAYDQQKLRLFYLTNGYADFRVISAVAELTPDRRDFVITYVVEEGERYKFGDVAVESDIRDLTPEAVRPLIPIKTGDWYDAKRVEDTVTTLNESAGVFGYAFADIEPEFKRDPETRTMSVIFRLADAPRVYVERIDVNGNTNTRDKVIRREFRLAEGDAFNTIRVRRSRDRIQSLGFFQENLEIEQTPGSTPDRVVLGVNVEEKPTGELQFSAGFSSIERFLINLSLAQRNFMGKGQTVRASVNYSTYSKSAELGFTEPYLFDRNIAVGADVYRRDFNSFNFSGNGERNTTYEQVTTGGALRAGVPLTENAVLALRYSLNLDEIALDERSFFSTDLQGNFTCDPLLAGRYLCDALGERTTSSVGYTLAYDTLDNRLRPTRGERASFSQDFAGLGGDVRYLRSVGRGAKFWRVGKGFVFSTSLEGGYIHSFEESRGPGSTPSA
jgi:outer membrane protein insertion porin family